MKLAAAALLIVVVGGWWVFLRDPGPEPLLDANRQQLATTKSEGYCSGQAFWQSGGRGDAQHMQDCVRADVRDLPSVQEAFCSGIKSRGYRDPVSVCLSIMRGNRYWPTLQGTITYSWNRAFPYPGDLVSSPPSDESRTGDREPSGRIEETR